jgi:magnesium transporter
MGTRQAGAHLKNNDLPTGFREDGPENMFSLARATLVKSANEPKLRCTEFDEKGKVVLMDSEFKKTELIQKVGLIKIRDSQITDLIV